MSEQKRYTATGKPCYKRNVCDLTPEELAQTGAATEILCAARGEGAMMMKASEMTNEELANYLWTKIPISTERNRCVLDEAATRLRNIAVIRDNINVIAELQRLLGFAEEGAVNTISGDDAEEIQRHFVAIREILKRVCGAKDGKR